ncbi:MarR family winged helix-turn-helix transcriptional regulator [Thalassotalea piscium]
MSNELISNNIVCLFQAYKQAMRSTLKANEIGLNAMHVKCLSYIYKAQSCTANDIVINLNRDKAQIARLVKEMIAKNWLIKMANPEDKRSQLLSLTHEGISLAKLIQQTHSEINQKMQSTLTRDELKEFTRVVGIICTNLQEP